MEDVTGVDDLFEKVFEYPKRFKNIMYFGRRRTSVRRDMNNELFEKVFENFSKRFKDKKTYHNTRRYANWS